MLAPTHAQDNDRHHGFASQSFPARKRHFAASATAGIDLAAGGLAGRIGARRARAANAGGGGDRRPVGRRPRAASRPTVSTWPCARKSVRTASHGLRVALIASGWATELNLPDHEREAIEIAALLHDVGILGLPDEILSKPGNLDPDESRLMNQAAEDERAQFSARPPPIHALKRSSSTSPPGTTDRVRLIRSAARRFLSDRG